MINLAEINAFIIKHADAKYFAADVKLYKKHFPQSRLIPELDRTPDFAKKQLDERILTELLQNQDSCIDCIWENRGFIRQENGTLLPVADLKKSGLTEDQIKEIAEKANVLIASIEKAKTLEEVAEIEKQVLELISPLPDGAKNPINYKLKETVQTAISQFEELAKLDELKRNENLLLNSDVEKLEYNEAKKLVFDLELEKFCSDHKAGTYKKVLAKYKQNLLDNGRNDVEEGGSGETEGTATDETGTNNNDEVEDDGDGSETTDSDPGEAVIESTEETTEAIPAGTPIDGNAKASNEPTPGNAQPAEEAKKKEDQDSSTQE